MFINILGSNGEPIYASLPQNHILQKDQVVGRRLCKSQTRLPCSWDIHHRQLSHRRYDREVSFGPPSEWANLWEDSRGEGVLWEWKLNGQSKGERMFDCDQCLGKCSSNGKNVMMVQLYKLIKFV